MAYGMLVILAEAQGIEEITSFMTPQQFIVFGVVMSIYLPCLATMTAMYKELGGKDTAIISVASIAIAVAIGAAFNAVLPLIL